MWNWPLYSIWSLFELRLYGSQNLWIVRIILVPKPQFAQNLSYGLLALNPQHVSRTHLCYCAVNTGQW